MKAATVEALSPKLILPKGQYSITFCIALYCKVSYYCIVNEKQVKMSTLNGTKGELNFSFLTKT